jgi:hypothetical protein
MATAILRGLIKIENHHKDPMGHFKNKLLCKNFLIFVNKHTLLI